MANWIIFFLFMFVIVVPFVYFWRQNKSQLELIGAKPATREAIRVPDYNKSLPVLNKEYARARRHQRPLSIIVARPKTNTRPHLVIPEVSVFPKRNKTDENDLNSSVLLHCGPVIRDTVRENDITTYDWQENRLIIALPESNKEQTYHVVNRFNSILGDDVASSLSVGIAEFPVDGLFIDELIDKAEGDQATARTIRKTNARKAIHSIS